MADTGTQPKRKRLLEILRGRYFWPLSLGAFIVLSIILWLTGPPIYKGLKNLRAEQLVTNAEKAYALEKDQWAFQAAQAALSLRPADYRALKVLALVMARADSNQALGLLLQLMNHENTSEEDKTQFQKQAFRLSLIYNRPDVAIGLLPHSTNDIETTDAEFSELVARYHQLYGNAANAIPWIRRAIQLQEQEQSPDDVEAVTQFSKRIELIQLALSQASANGDTIEFRDLLWDPAMSQQPPDLEALRLLAYSADLTDDDLRILAQTLETHPEANFQDKLTAVDLRVRRNPQDQQRIIKDTLYRFGSTVGANAEGPVYVLDNGEKLQIEIATAATLEMELDRRIDLARWLNRNGKGSQVSELFTIEEARQNQDVALILLDGLAENAQWAEIEILLSRERLKVPQLLKDLYLARTSRELGYKNAFQISWEPIEKAFIDRPKAFWYAAEYARVMGEFERAEALYERLIPFPEVRWRSYIALIQLGEIKGDTQGLLNLLVRMSADYPANTTIKNDLAYLRSLLNTNIPDARKAADDLVKSHPEIPAHHVTLALCMIREGQLNEAESLLDELNLQWDRALPGWKAVRIHLLKHAGRTQEADILLEGLNQEALKPEEVGLLN